MKHYSKEEILEILKRHESVSVAYTELDRQRALENPSLEKFKCGLRKFSEGLKDTPTEPLVFSLFRKFEEDGNRMIFESKYFNRRQKLTAYALEYWLFREEEALKYLQDIIWVILEEYTWALPAHLGGKSLSVKQADGTYVVDLFAAETAQALSEILTFLGDDLHPILKDRIHFEIERRILSRAYENMGEFFWHKTSNNWSAVCSGSVGMTAIYEIKDNERLAYFINNTLSTLENFYQGFSADGACLEGLGYWAYGFGYFMCFADMLYRRTEGEINLFDDPHIKNIAFFYTKMFFKGSRTVSFSDGGSRGKCSMWALSILSRYYPDYILPGAEYINFDYSGNGCSRFASSLRDVVCTRNDLKSGNNEIVGTYKLSDAGWYIASSSSGIGIAAKAGHNAEPHNHNDVGSFLIFKNGESMISDIGSGEYTRKYFSNERYDIFCNSSASHSVPIIDGKYQESGRAAQAKDVRIFDDGIESDIACAYDIPALKSLKRRVFFDYESGLTRIRDEFDFDELPSSVVERFIAPENPEVNHGNVVLKTGNQKMTIYFEADKWDARVNTVVDKDHSANDRKTYTIDFVLKKLERSICGNFEIK